MNRRKITLLSSLLISMATALFACTPAQNKESVNDGQVAQKKGIANVGQTALKNWNEPITD
ncbi:hypothetical protein NDK43_22005 [Neobacillus pocheonensis]|uniref:Uncharacterized protein n=1 Tax=Neobacillus pocheonensis TaxID=363869 RepID=A0ABT0WDX5_9BACI|nr:hypothetical protein [Neobacillus pocheonensis]